MQFTSDKKHSKNTINVFLCSSTYCRFDKIPSEWSKSCENPIQSLKSQLMKTGFSFVMRYNCKSKYKSISLEKCFLYWISHVVNSIRLIRSGSLTDFNISNIYHLYFCQKCQFQNNQICSCNQESSASVIQNNIPVKSYRSLSIPIYCLVIS